MTYNDAKTLIHKLKITSFLEWKKLIASNEFEKYNIPKNPPQTYKNEWTNWADFFGPSYIPIKGQWLNYDEIKSLIRNLGIKSQVVYRKINDPRLPSHPERVYNNEWRGWGDFLGTGNLMNKEKVFLSFNDARKITRELGLKSNKDWRTYSKHKRPLNIPGNPDSYYKDKGWKGWPDFLGYI